MRVVVRDTCDADNDNLHIPIGKGTTFRSRSGSDNIELVACVIHIKVVTIHILIYAKIPLAQVQPAAPYPSKAKCEIFSSLCLDQA